VERTVDEGLIEGAVPATVDETFVLVPPEGMDEIDMPMVEKES
jgi:hypothetical protein